MLIVAFTAVAILAWLGAALVLNAHRAGRPVPGARALENRGPGIAEEAGDWLRTLDEDA